MAGLLCMAVTAEVASGTSQITVLQVAAPANQRLKLLRWGASFDGTSPVAEPVVVRLLRQSTAGTMTSLTPVNLGVGTETPQATAQHTATVEPTAGSVLDRVEVHPQSGFEVIFPLGQEVLIPGGGRLGIEVLAAATVNVVAKMMYEE